MKIINRFFFIALLAIPFACGDDDESIPPEAGFTFEVNELTVTFTNTSTNANEYTWDFGDGNTSTDASPNHTYVEAGVYQVVLTATGSGLSDDIEQSVNIALEGVTPSVGFTFTVVSEGEVSFTNTSVNATEYLWDFGDNNTSDEVSPVHTYRESGTYDVVLTAINGDLTNDATESVQVTITPENERKSSGFIVVGANDDGSTIFTRYFEEVPSGTIDLTQGQAFQNFFLIDVFDGAVWTQRTDDSNGFAKMGVDGNGLIVEDGFIATDAPNAFTLRIRDSDTGIFIDPNDFSQVRVFDPKTLALTGNIDLSAAALFTDRPEASVSSAVIRGDDVFISYAQGTGPLLDNFTMIRGSISSGMLGNQVNSTTGPTFTFNPLHRLTDEQGDLYIHHTGNLSPAPLSNIGGVLRIPAGSDEFDESYDFRVIGNPALILHSMRAFSYYENGIAYAHIGLETPQAVVDILISVGGDITNLTPEQIDQILLLLNISENAGWVELDLAAQTIRELPGMPRLNPFAATNAYWIDNVPHFPIVNTTQNAVYKYDPVTDQSTKVFDVTGATVTAIIDLSSNNNR